MSINMNGTKPPSSTAILKRLVILALAVLVFFIYAYGWQATDISLKEPQDPQRGAQLSRALRELLSPNIFTQDRTSELTIADFHVGNAAACEELAATEQAVDYPDDKPYIILTPNCGQSDDLITVEGFNFEFEPRNTGIIRWRLPSNTIPLDRFELDGDGHFKIEVEVPKLGRTNSEDVHSVEGESYTPTGNVRLTETTKTVIEKMIETIFLALMATTLALPIAIFLSFLAARNLMRQITMPLGNVLVGFILFPIGWILGQAIVSVVQDPNVLIPSFLDIEPVDLGILSPLPAIVIGLLLLAAYWLLNNANADGSNSLLKSTSRWLLGFAVLVFIISSVSILGDFAQWGGEKFLEVATLQDAANMVMTLGELTGLILSLVAGIGGGFYLASAGSTAAIPLLKPIRGIASHILSAILGGITMGLILFGLAEISQEAALLILLVPLVAAVIGGQIPPMVYNFIVPREQHIKPTGTRKWIEQGLALLGAVITFWVVFQLMNAQRGIIDGRRPLEEEMTILGMSMRIYTLRALLIGIVLGAINGGFSGIHQRFPLGMVIYNTNRTILNSMRSIEPLIMGIIFVIWVGIGPFAGMLALALHSIASLGKLYSEQVENIDQGPIEAIQATGANRLQTIVYAVVPQIVPPYIAFTMYRWDINVRMSTIIGFVGGGGIGFLLSQQINQLRYQEAGVAVLAIAIVVTVLDYASAFIRERMI